MAEMKGEMPEILFSELLQAGMDAQIGSSRGECVGDILVTISSLGIRGKVVARLRKVSPLFPLHAPFPKVLTASGDCSDISSSYECPDRSPDLARDLHSRPLQRPPGLWPIHLRRCAAAPSRPAPFHDHAGRHWLDCCSGNTVQLVDQPSPFPRSITASRRFEPDLAVRLSRARSGG